MFLKRTLCTALFSCVALLSAFAQDQGARTEIEEALKSRYRLTTVGGGVMGVRGENSIRKTGGVVVLVRDGLYGSYNRRDLASNAIVDGKAEVRSGAKDLALARGEKFYVTAAYVGSDLVFLGLLSARMIPGNTKTAQVWCSVSFFFSKDMLDQGGHRQDLLCDRPVAASRRNESSSLCFFSSFGFYPTCCYHQCARDSHERD